MRAAAAASAAALSSIYRLLSLALMSVADVIVIGAGTCSSASNKNDAPRR
jgi:hypothetical protein